MNHLFIFVLCLTVFIRHSAISQFAPSPIHLMGAILDAANDDELYMAYLNEGEKFTRSELNTNYQEINREISHDRKNPALYYKRAILKRKSGQKLDGITDFDMAYKLAKSQNMSQQILDSIEFEKCLSDVKSTQVTKNYCIDSYIAKYPANDRARFFKGLFYYCFMVSHRQERFSNAAMAFEDFLGKYPTDKEAMLLLGMCYYRLEDYDTALTTYDKLIALYPTFGRVYTQRGKLYEKIGSKSEACANFSKAIQLGATDAIGFQNKHCR